MGNAIYLTGFPGPSGTLDYPVLGQFPVDAGADPFDLRASRGLAYLLRAAPANPDVDVVLAGGPPFPAGMIDYPTPFQVSWPGARTTIYPAASLGRSWRPMIPRPTRMSAASSTGPSTTAPSFSTASSPPHRARAAPAPS
jgi:hypothetical protein